MAKQSVIKQITMPVQGNKVTAEKQQTGNKKQSAQIKLIFVLGIISLLVYANTLKNSYALDDVAVITENKFVQKGISAIPEILSTPYHRGNFITTNDLYRPLSLVTFAIEYQFFGMNPTPGHLVNVLLFACCVVLLFRFLDALFDHRKMVVAFIASLLFALHPIHTEVVANIKSRDELLCFSLVFLCLNLFFKYFTDGKISQLLLGSLCFFLSLLSKETVITFLAVIPVIFLFFRNENKKRGIYLTICSVIVVVTALLIRFSVLNYYHANELTEVSFIDNALSSKDISFGERIATAILILGNYVKLLFVPYPLVCDYSFNSIPFTQFGDPRVLISLAAYIFFIAFSIKRFMKNHKDPYAFGLFFFLVTISLFSNIPFLIGTPMGERLLFFPSVGFCLIVAVAIEQWVARTELTYPSFLKNTYTLSVLVPVCLIYVFLTISRNSDWMDNITLYKADVETAPNNTRLNYYNGKNLLGAATGEKDTVKKRKILNESISYLRKAVEIYPGYINAQLDLGWAYNLVYAYDSAEKHEKIAVELSPGNVIARNDLAIIYSAAKKYTNAIEIYREILKLDPNFAGVHSGLGSAFLNNGLYDSAEVHIMIAIRQTPENTAAINNLVGIYFAKQNFQAAVELSKKAIALNPRYIDPYINVAGGYLNMKKVDSGIYYLYKAIAVEPGYSRAYEFLASAYLSIAKLDSARKYEAIAKKNNPGFALKY